MHPHTSVSTRRHLDDRFLTMYIETVLELGFESSLSGTGEGCTTGVCLRTSSTLDEHFYHDECDDCVLV